MSNKMILGMFVSLVALLGTFGILAASGALTSNTTVSADEHRQEGKKGEKKDKGDRDERGNQEGRGNQDERGNQDDREDRDRPGARRICADLPSHSELLTALDGVVTAGVTGSNGGLSNDMWATVVNRDGLVCAVTFSGDDRGKQWPGSRVISAQKANTANAFSLPHDGGGIPGLALSTANLFSAVQPGGSLFGLQESNPVDTTVAYRGPASRFGLPRDPMVGQAIGGVNVFGGGLALYNADGALVGGLGVSGDTSCTDHNVSWKVRHSLNLDNVIAGVAPGGTDNIVNDVSVDGATGHTTSPSGWGHPECDATATAVAAALPAGFPVGPAE